MVKGQQVKVREGASAWMKEHNFWAEYLGDNIDGKAGPIVGDYTNLPGNMSHFELELGLGIGVGVHPQFLVEITA